MPVAGGQARFWVKLGKLPANHRTGRCPKDLATGDFGRLPADPGPIIEKIAASISWRFRNQHHAFLGVDLQHAPRPVGEQSGMIGEDQSTAGGKIRIEKIDVPVVDQAADPRMDRRRLVDQDAL